MREIHVHFVFEEIQCIKLAGSSAQTHQKFHLINSRFAKSTQSMPNTNLIWVSIYKTVQEKQFGIVSDWMYIHQQNREWKSEKFPKLTLQLKPKRNEKMMKAECSRTSFISFTGDCAIFDQSILVVKLVNLTLYRELSWQ